MGKKGDPDKPKGRMSAYAFFVQSCRQEHKKQHPGESVVFAEFSKKCAERWKKMTDKEKKVFHDLADKDKIRYNLAMDKYVPPLGEGKKGRKRKRKDPDAPKRNLSPFFLFCNIERPKVKKIYPDFGVGDVAKKLGEAWKNVSAADKAKYEKEAAKAKIVYEKDMAAYKERKAKGDARPEPPPPKKVAMEKKKPETSSSEEEDSDDSDESDEE